MAEIELQVLNKQCLNRRIDNIEKVDRETKAWEKARNRQTKTINWQFTTEDARIKLKRLYPTIGIQSLNFLLFKLDSKKIHKKIFFRCILN